jgi:TPR domain/SEC-C domain protein
MKKKKAKRRDKRAAHRAHTPQKIRLGYLSSDFGEGRWRDFLPAFFINYDSLRFEVYAYHIGSNGDPTPFSKAEIQAFRRLDACSSEEAAEVIRQDALDLLVDLSPLVPDRFTQEILRRRPADRQVSLAEHCPADLALSLSSVPEAGFWLPWCYQPLDLLTMYAYRTPLLDDAVPTIGFVGCMEEGTQEVFLSLLEGLLDRIPRVRLIVPAGLASRLSESNLARLMAEGSDAAQIQFVDEMPYDAVDLVIGIGVDLLDVCRAAEHSIPLLTAQELTRSSFVAPALLMLEITEGCSADIAELLLHAEQLLRDKERLAQLHHLLYWRLRDSALVASGTYMFTMERAYSRVLADGVQWNAQEMNEALTHAEEQRDWHRVVSLAHELDGHDALGLAQRMTLAWSYFFLDVKPFASRWALCAKGIAREREGTRLYLFAVGADVFESKREALCYVEGGIAQIEAGLPVIPEVYSALLGARVRCGTYIRSNEELSGYAMACVQAETTWERKQGYYTAALLYLNAVDIDPEEIYLRSLEYEAFFADVTPYTHLNRRAKKKIRIGYISGDFRQHVMQYFIWPFLAGYSQDKFEVYVYSLGKEDQYTKFFKTLVTKWNDLSVWMQDYGRIAHKIYKDEIDILFDLAGYTKDSGLPALAWKPAPVQVSGLGYMATTGLTAVDYFVTDHCCDPEGSGSESYFVEKLLRLTSQFCYNGYTNLPTSMGAPVRKRGYIQFASFNQYTKLQDAMLRAWQKIMMRVPTARLLLKSIDYQQSSVAISAYQRLQRLGFDMSRVQFEVGTTDYMHRYLDVDIALDTFPWTGGGTTCDALYMGVPVISYYTKRHSTRFTYSILSSIGLGDLASDRLEDYVETAVALAENIDLLDMLHRELRDRMKASPLMDQEHYIREMEGCYCEIWARYKAQSEALRACI